MNKTKTPEDFLQTEFDKENLGNTTQVQFCYEAIKIAMNEYAKQGHCTHDILHRGVCVACGFRVINKDTF